MARAFTPKLTQLVENPLYSDVWADKTLSARDRSIATVAAVIALYRPEELPAHLRRAIDNGVTRDELSALITPYCLLCRLSRGDFGIRNRCSDIDSSNAG
jgi:4-carboxymuconolactone decarboxylase